MTEKADRAKDLLERLAPYFEARRSKYAQMLIDAPVNSEDQNVTLLLDLKKMLVALDDVETDIENDIRDGVLEDFRANEKGYLGDVNGKRKH